MNIGALIFTVVTHIAGIIVLAIRAIWRDN